ncbi:MAG: RNA polymerase sigma factor [Bacteroidota bacterium]|nr:RNA polymerase sigma factor [Bacteroidota bacterium]
MNEASLIQALRQADETAFRLLVETYRNRVYHTVLSILQDASEAEDAAQEVFIKVFETIHSFRGDAGLATWIYRIAVNKALDKLRRKKRRALLHSLLPIHEEMQPPEPFYHPGVAMDKKEEAAALFKAVGMLSARQQTAFTLIKIQGMSYAEAAYTMNLSVKAIESLVSRAKQQMQKTLAAYETARKP